MSAHTPGPWCDISDQPKGRFAGPRRMAMVTTGKGSAIDCTESGDTFLEDCANARLIAAAPCLLERLAAATSRLEMAAECIEAGRYDEALLHARSLAHLDRAAIAKATGEQA